MFLFITIAPALALIIYFYNKDKYKKEPLALLLAAFLGGFIIVLFAIVIENILLIFLIPIGNFFLKIFLKAFLVAALIEEGLKFIVFKYLIYNHNEFDEPYDGIMYAVMISLGFATLENIIYLLSAYFETGFFGMMNLGIMRGIFAIPIHAFCGVIMGYHLGLAKFARNQVSQELYIYKALWFAFLAHGLYDFFLFTRTWLGLIFMLILFIFCWCFSVKAVKIHAGKSSLNDQLFP
jgi:RsiW-degrading membrane proteinase PrsW (M82 family)